MKKNIFIPFVLLIIMSIGSQVFSEAQEEVLLKLSVRVMTKGEGNTPPVYITNLEKKDFQLRVNGAPCEIREFSRKERSIARDIQDEHLIRQFALSFDIDECSPDVRAYIINFVNRFLTPSDRLLVRTPSNIYKIDTTAPKEDIVKFIQSSLEKDIETLNQDKDALQRSLNNLLQNLEGRFAAKKTDIGSIRFFIDYFSTVWSNYCSQFLQSNLDRFLEIASLMAKEEKNGERWIIHINKKEADSYSTRFMALSEKIRVFLSSITGKNREKVPPVLDKLGKVEKYFDLEGFTPVSDLTDSLLSANVGLNVLTISQTKDTTSDYGLDKIYKTLALRTGGIVVNPVILIDGLDKVVEHVDMYYDIIFPFDGVSSDKKIELQVIGSDNDLFYKTGFKKEELSWISDWMQARPLTISQYKLEGRRLSFSVNGFRKSNEGKGGGNTVLSGKVKLNIRLFDNSQAVIYENENTFNSQEESISLSFLFPDEHKGYFKLSIVADDLISGKNTELKEYIQLK